MFPPELQPWLCRRRSHHYSCVFCLAYQFFRVRPEIRRAVVFGFGIVNRFQTMLVKGKLFLAEPFTNGRSSWGDSLRDSLHNQPGCRDCIHKTQTNHYIWMPAGWVSVVSDQISDSVPGSDEVPTSSSMLTQGFLILNESWRIASKNLPQKAI